MTKNFTRISGAVNCAAGLISILAVRFFAPACAGMLELANGNQTHMRCFYAGRAVCLLGALLFLAGLLTLIKREADPAIAILAAAIAITALLALNGSIGIGVCANSEMMCGSMSAWIRGCAAFSLIGNALVFVPSKAAIPQA